MGKWGSLVVFLTPELCGLIEKDLQQVLKRKYDWGHDLVGFVS